jgi:hypothetical protein
MEGQSQSVQHDPIENILDDFREWLHFQETRWRNGRALKELHWSPGIAPGEPLLDPKLRQANSKPRPIAMRLLRTAAFGLAAAVIASATVAWHFSDDQTKEMLRGWGLSQSISIIRTISPDISVKSASNTSIQEPTGDTAHFETAPSNQSAQARSGLPSELFRQLETMGNDIANLQRNVERLAVKQEQMAQEIASLKSTEQSLVQKLSPPPSQASPAPVIAPKNAPKTGRPDPSSSLTGSSHPIHAPLPLH